MVLGVIYYAIREKTTGRFLPSRAKAHTHSEPMDAADVPPRMFVTSKAARTALTFWAKGPVMQAAPKGSHSSFLDLAGDVDLTYSHSDCERNADDFEVVALNCVPGRVIKPYSKNS